MGAPATKLFAVYAKEFLKVYLGARKYEPYWVDMRFKLDTARDHVKTVDELIDDTTSPDIKPLGVMAIIGPPLDARVGRKLQEERQKLQTSIRNVISNLDGLAAGTADLILACRRLIQDIDAFQSKDNKRSTFELAYGPGSLSSERNSLCCCVSELYDCLGRLISHRNRWAELAVPAGMSWIGVRRFPSFIELENQCRL